MIGYLTFIKNESHFDRIKLVNAKASTRFNSNPGAVFLVSALLFVSCQSLTYYLFGMPLFMNNRLLVYQSGGFGILGRVLDVTLVVSFYSYLYYTSQGKMTFFYKMLIFLYLIFLLLSLFLNGSKMGVLSLIFILVIFSNIESRKRNVDLLKGYMVRVWTIFIIAVCSAIVILMFNYNIFSRLNDFLDVFLVLFLRIINSAEIYVMAYPNDALFIHQPEHNGFVALFKDLLATFRFISGSDVPNSLGNVAANLHVSTDIGGPNTRLSVFGYYYFGFLGSLLFAFILGTILSFFRHKLTRVLPSHPLLGGALAYFILHFSSLEIDPVYQFSKLTNFLIVFPLLIFLLIIIPTKGNVKCQS
ncbi:hypothetical protein ACK344_14755 [Aeromonas veronii]